MPKPAFTIAVAALIASIWLETFRWSGRGNPELRGHADEHSDAFRIRLCSKLV